jgi:hypothetical protein
MVDRVTFDLDAARAARRAKLGKNPTVTVDGRTWTLVPEVPLSTLEDIDAGRARAALQRLVVDDADEFDVGGWSVEDVKDLLRQVYGLGPTT